MTGLTQKALRTILATIFSVDEKWVVPKEGNWFNPQALQGLNDRPDTWIAFRVARTKQVSNPYYQQDDGETPVEGNWDIILEKVSDVELQIVGQNAEQIAYSLGAWAKRIDVQEAFDEIGGVLMMMDFNVIATNFYQDGANSIIAYNTGFKVAWVDIIRANQQTVTSVTIGGTLNG